MQVMCPLFSTRFALGYSSGKLPFAWHARVPFGRRRCRVDMLLINAENTVMKTLDDPTEVDIESQAILDHLMTGKPIDPEMKRKIHERAAKITQEVRDKFGLVDIAVPAIRELRGELPNP